MGSTDKHCSVSDANCGKVASSQSAHRATIGFHIDAHRTLQVGSGPEPQSAVWQHAAFSCSDIALTVAAHSSSAPMLSCERTPCAAQNTRASSRIVRNRG